MTDGPAGNLLASLRRAGGTLLALVETRIELIVVEFEEERARLGVLLLIGALAFVCLALGIALVTLFIIVLFWDTYRLEAIGGLAVLSLLAGGLLFRAMRTKAREQPRLFAASIAELRRDREELHGGGAQDEGQASS
jgi:uncharacterized membrane protein YqjE